MGNFDNFISLDLGKMDADDGRFGRGKRIQRLKVAAGESKVIRILRGPTEASFYRIRSQHWKIPMGQGSNAPLSCSKKHADEPCYFCEQVNRLFNSDDPRENDLARQMKASVSVISNVIDVNDPVKEDGSPKVLIWNYSWKLFQDVRAYFRDPDYGDLTHPATGRNFKITASKVSSQGSRTWIRYDLQVGAKPTELEVPEALNNLHDLDETFPVKLYTYEEQKMIWNGEWNPRGGSAALPASAASTAPRIETTPAAPEKEEFETSADKDEGEDFETSADKDEGEDFETSAQGDDEWDDLLDDSVDDEKQKDIRNKLNKLKKAAKKK
jgi:hypothetical protein